MTLSLTGPFTFPYYTGSPVTLEVPGKWPIALDGRAYMLDVASDRWTHKSIPYLRPQSDDSASPAEASLNPEVLWRRAQDSWHRGAGQTFRDRNGDPERFRDSKGINCWTPYEFSLLPATDQKRSGSSTNYRVVPAGTRLYLMDGSAIFYATDITVDSPTWNATTYAGGAVLDITSDGFNVYATDGANVYVSNTGSATFTSTNTLNAGVLAFVKGRLMAAGTGATKHLIYNITTIGTAPDPLFTPFNTDFTWVGFAEGQANIYAAGFSGDKSLIYRIAVKPDGTELDQPVIAGQLPDGEVIRAIGGYLGFVFLGTDKGVRFCETDGQGNLNIGPLVATPSAVRCFEGQEKYVWFGWTNYDATSTGLGRLDLTQFTENPVTGGRTPAYASDLMATAQGNVLSVATFQGFTVFTVAESGVWAEDAPLVVSGSMDSGLIGFGLPDAKTAVQVDVRTEPLAGEYAVDLAIDSGTFATAGAEDSAGSVGEPFALFDADGERFELRFTLERDASDDETGPTVTRWTLKATPGPTDGPSEYIILPVLLHQTVTLPGGFQEPVDVERERDYLKELRQTRRIVTLQDGSSSHQVQVENYEWFPVGFRADDFGGQFRIEDGTMLLQLKTIS